MKSPLLSIVLCSLSASAIFSAAAEDSIYRCGDAYFSHPCDKGTPLRQHKINRYKQPDSYLSISSEIKQESLPVHKDMHKDKGSVISDAQPENKDLNANSGGVASLTVRGSDVDRILLQLGVKKCDETIRKERPELCK